MDDPKPVVTMYTDGGADPNPGPGGWAVVLMFDRNGEQITRELSGGEPHTTNNRMEITAAIQGFRALKRPCTVELYTDSTYLKNGITEWMDNWLRTDFKRGKIQNADLWRVLHEEQQRHTVNWHWVRGHAGDQWNERADQLATAAIARQVPEPDHGVTQVYLRVSCVGTVGGWAALLDAPDHRATMITGSEPRTTPNRLDLIAAIRVLESLRSDESVQVFTANSYLQRGVTQWLPAWKRSNWTKKEGGQVRHRDLWERLDALMQIRQVSWVLYKDEDRPAEQLDLLDDPLKQAVEEAHRLAEST
jgi:ribonuclease HI